MSHANFLLVLFLDKRELPLDPVDVHVPT
jgi:hypothetical protein